MNVVDLVNDPKTYLGQEVTVVGKLDRPRKKHSNYLFFNIEDPTGGIQAVVKQDLLGTDLFKELIYGLCQKDTVEVIGTFGPRASNRADFYDYEITVKDIKKIN
jgi:aspartyl/asparaginyl-tRNA synthetase